MCPALRSPASVAGTGVTTERGHTCVNSLCWPTEEEAWWLWRGLPLGGALKLCGKEGEGYGGWKDQDQLRSGMVVGRGGWGDSVEPGQVSALPGKG